jgi:hypothetical protein
MFITIIGSARFEAEWFTVAKQLTLEGHVVLMTHVFKEAPVELEPMLLELDRQRLDISDMIYVLNVGGYLGADSRAMLEYACHLPRRYHCPT